MLLFAKIKPFIKLMRLDKPVGIYLLLWPTLSSLWIASNGFPDLKLLCIFIFGVILTRSAGCVINDLSDMKFDKFVSRTQNRPLVNGEVSKKSAWILFVVLLMIAFILVLQTNLLTLMFSLVAVILMSIYPLMKRIIHTPQFILGLAFSWAVPMTFAANNNTNLSGSIALMSYVILWAVIYDTIYAMIDKPDDLKIGVKSTAILFSPYEKYWIALLQILLFGVLIYVGYIFNLKLIYFITVVCAIFLMIYHQWLIRKPDKQLYFKAFLHNHWIGFVILIGIMSSFIMY